MKPIHYEMSYQLIGRYFRIRRLLGFVVVFQLFVFLFVGIIPHYWYQPSATIVSQTPENDTAEAFLQYFHNYCNNHLAPRQINKAKDSSAKLCPCIPNDLVGQFNVTFDPPLFGELELRHSDLFPGGSWTPRWCRARQRVAIIIPFRDREHHLRTLLNILHPMLQRQLLQYTIFVVEQNAPAVFNKASLMNVGFTVARSFNEFDCFIFHDVDMLPENDYNFYTCSPMPRHVGSHISKWSYEVPYPELFGGVTAFRGEHFELANGFSNQYYGWGGEDDDMYCRLKAKNFTIVRFSKSVARYTMIKHESDVGNPYNTKSNAAWKLRPQLYAIDGLNSLRYRLDAIETRPLYTWLHVTLPPHPPYFHGEFRSRSSAADPSIHQAGRCRLSLVVQLVFVVCATISRTFYET